MDERREDWRSGVDENLASLNAGQRVWERDLASIRKALADIDKLLRGDPEKDTDGMIPRLHQQENDVNLIKAVLLKDKAGNKGLVGRVDDLETGERRADRHLKLWIAFVGLLSACLAAGVSNVDRIQTFFNHKRKLDPLDQMIERAKRPKVRRHHVVLREEPAEADPDTQD